MENTQAVRIDKQSLISTFRSSEKSTGSNMLNDPISSPQERERVNFGHDYIQNYGYKSDDSKEYLPDMRQVITSIENLQNAVINYNSNE